jgi:hypothetical protein
VAVSRQPTQAPRRALFAPVTEAVRSRPVAAHLTLMGALVFSAAVHAGLTSQHFRESPFLGVAFVGAALTTTGIAVALALYPASPLPPRAAALMFAAQIVAYFLFTDHLTEPIGVLTKLVEAFGFVVAVAMQPTPELEQQRRNLLPTYVLLVAFGLLVALQASGHKH